MSTGGQTDVTDVDHAQGTKVAPGAQDLTAGSGASGTPGTAGEGSPAVPAGGQSAAGSATDSGEITDSAEATDSGVTTSDGEPRSSRSSRSSVEDLEEEGDVAADYLEELLDIVDVDGDIDIDVENGRASLAIVAEAESIRSLRRLVGANGEVLEALQELTRLAVQASTGDRSRLMLDIAGHRAARREVLTQKATQACERVKTSGESVRMEPMTAFERKIVHDVVADAGLNSESEGVDPGRRVVILPA